MLTQRIITILWGLPILIAAVWFGTPWFTILLILWGILATYEFYRLANVKLSPLNYLGLIFTGIIIASPEYDQLQLPVLLTASIIITLLWLLIRHRTNNFTNWGWTIAGIFYIGWLLQFLISLRLISSGREWVFLALLTTFASDTTAYLIGKRFGRHFLIPAISPGKTWEGTTAGIIASVIVALIFHLFSLLPLNYAHAILLGVLISIFGQLGDLIESLLKRNMGVKDSGNLLVGHGGFLDRLDSVVFAGVVVYYYATWVIT